MQALVTVTNERYIEGTEVLLHSFLQQHPDFSGDLIVVHQDLPKKSQNRLSALFNVHFRPVSQVLKLAIAQLVDGQPTLKQRHQRFWSLEVFHLTEYEQVLYLDSDILCQGNMNSLWTLPASFAACADAGLHEGLGRHPLTFETLHSDIPDIKPIESFNAGMFFFRPQLLADDSFSQLLKWLQPSVFTQVTTGHTDQYLLNRHFQGQVHWLNAGYNYLLRKSAFIEDHSPETALVWHYIRHPKPWKLKKLAQERLLGRPTPPFWKEWHIVYRKILLQKMRKGFQLRYPIQWLVSRLCA